MRFVTQAMQAVPAGRYVVAVSGGLDSMALLDMLRRRSDLEIFVAHVNHGIRSDADLDQKMVVSFCKSYNIHCDIEVLHLGEHASESRAREARYRFLRKCRIQHNAHAIITAHHMDDLLETALINMLRGTDWRGLAPFTQGTDVMRPLVSAAKNELKVYAEANNVPWNEDSTNSDQRYLRNYVRLTAMPFLDVQNSDWRIEFMRLIRMQQLLRRTIESELDSLITLSAAFTPNGVRLQRYLWCMLEAPEAYELFQGLCRKILGNSLLREQAASALVFMKVARPGKSMPLGKDWQLRAAASELIVERRSSVVQ